MSNLNKNKTIACVSVDVVDKGIHAHAVHPVAEACNKQRYKITLQVKFKGQIILQVKRKAHSGFTS